MNEFVIEWIKNSSYAGVTVPTGTAWKSKLMRYVETHPNEVKLIAENNDGSAFFHVPVKWIKCSPPRKVSVKQKEVAAERFKKMWEERRL